MHGGQRVGGGAGRWMGWEQIVGKCVSLGQRASPGRRNKVVDHNDVSGGRAELEMERA